MMLILKAANVKQPGSRGGKYWIDEHGNVRYDEKPVEKKRVHKYIAQIVLSDGTKKYIEPKPEELDGNNQVIGGQSGIREIINRELFGEDGFKTDGTFWQRRGILFEYKVRTSKNGKIVVDPIQRHAGYTSFEFRDSSIARAYGGSEDGLPKKITQYHVSSQIKEDLPSKTKIDHALGTTADKPPTIEELGIHTVRPRLPEHHVAVGEPLTAEENVLDIADAYLATVLEARRASRAKTEAGQARARDDRKGQFDQVVGARKIKKLP